MLIYIKNESNALGECKRQLNGLKKANMQQKTEKYTVNDQTMEYHYPQPVIRAPWRHWNAYAVLNRSCLRNSSHPLNTTTSPSNSYLLSHSFSNTWNFCNYISVSVRTQHFHCCFNAYITPVISIFVHGLFKSYFFAFIPQNKNDNKNSSAILLIAK